MKILLPFIAAGLAAAQTPDIAGLDQRQNYSKDGIAKDVFSSTSEQQSKYRFHLVRTEQYRARPTVDK